MIRVKAVIALSVLAVLCTACAPAGPRATIAATPSMAPAGCEMPVSYDSLDDFIADAKEIVTASAEGGDVLRAFKVPASEVMIPGPVPYTERVEAIAAGPYHIAYDYELDEAYRDDFPFPITLVWRHCMTPQTLLADFPAPEALSSKIIEGDDGTKFHVEEHQFVYLMTDYRVKGYTVRWASCGKAYSASIPGWFTDDDIVSLNSFVDVRAFAPDP